jgi:hypothetical protein
MSQLSVTDKSTEVSAVAALYQSERADASAIMNTSLALVGAGAAYLVGTIALWDKFSLLKGWIVLLPFPLACVAAFHSLLVASAVTKARSILLLEPRLKIYANIDQAEYDDIGALASERVMNVQKARHWAYSASNIITYGGVGAVVVGYTVAIVVQSVKFINWWAIAPVIFYAILLTVVACSWIAATKATGEVPA